ncbi:Helix-turn-helix domain protein [Rubripirellula obstinata]|uniref:Helix-turn-helix domain protein n=1 Tax=Rubripirellula obstinata TaxID=406547 RepID=A0A5B1CEH8_9BACT|nr:helix-turn-helix domain-containing protein [Rubripirellula obstinata]KAA1258622.1 Helix-turn-helix domain protein [Rubripirellula obstinata]
MAFTVPSPGGDNVKCLSRDDAAKQLGISSRTLYERTAPRGPIFAVRFGRRVLYPVAEIDRYIAEQIASQSDKKNGGAK